MHNYLANAVDGEEKKDDVDGAEDPKAPTVLDDNQAVDPGRGLGEELLQFFQGFFLPSLEATQPSREPESIEEASPTL